MLNIETETDAVAIGKSLSTQGPRRRGMEEQWVV